MTLRLLIISLILIPTAALAQFEDELDQDDKAADAVSESVGQAKLSVDSADIKALEAAKVAKSEEGIIKAASRILGVDSKHLLALNTLGVFYFDQGKTGLAKVIFNRALAVHPDSPTLHNNLGIIALTENKPRQALASFRKALEIKRDHRIAAANLGSILLEYKDYDRAIAPLEAGYKATRSELKTGAASAVEVANNYAVALSSLGKYNDAEEIYEEIVAGSSRQPTVLLNYAILLIDKKKSFKEGGKLLSRIKFAVDDPKVLKRVEELEQRVNSGE